MPQTLTFNAAQLMHTTQMVNDSAMWPKRLSLIPTKKIYRSITGRSFVRSSSSRLQSGWEQLYSCPYNTKIVLGELADNGDRFIGVSANLSVTTSGNVTGSLSTLQAPCWGFAVMLAIYVAGGSSGAFLNRKYRLSFVIAEHY